MDNLTHTLTGLMLSRAGFNRFTPRASVLLMLAANAPDIDTIAFLGGATTYLDWHRGPTHSLLLAPLMAGLVTLVVGMVRRPPGFPWGKAFLAALAGVVSHCLLDWTNIYGIRLLAPWSKHWFRLDSVPVVDIWIWAILLLAVAWPALAKLVSSEIGARRGRPGTGMARFALVFLLAYDFGRWTLHGRAVETLNAFLYDNRPPRRVYAMPDLASPFAWRGLVDLGDAWHINTLSLLTPFDPATGRLYYNATASPPLTAARRTQPFQAIERFSSTLHWRLLPAGEPEGSVEVVATDLRFALPGEGRFAARAVVAPNLTVIEAAFRFTPRGKLPQPR
jgi:inner membrane protein